MDIFVSEHDVGNGQIMTSRNREAILSKHILAGAIVVDHMGVEFLQEGNVVHCQVVFQFPFKRHREDTLNCSSADLIKPLSET